MKKNKSFDLNGVVRCVLKTNKQTKNENITTGIEDYNYKMPLLKQLIMNFRSKHAQKEREKISQLKAV